MARGDIYIRTKGVDYGPYKETELRSHIKAGRVPFSAWLFFEEAWVLLGENAQLRALHPEFEPVPESAPSSAKAVAELVLESKTAPPARSRGETGTVSAEPLWFFIREKKKYGPYSAAELISQLQRKQLDATTYVWKPGFSTWQKMSQVSEFSREAMKRLVSDSEPLDILVKRKHPRAPYEVDVIAHDNTKAVEGKSMVIGEGGLFLATSKTQHAVGARLKLHFRQADTTSFNAVAEVVSVVRGENSGYCMRFVALSDSDRRQIAKLVSERRKK